MSDFDEVVRELNEGFANLSDAKLLSAGSDHAHEHHWRVRTQGGELVTVTVTRGECEVVQPHHPDCECPVCKRGEDEHCTYLACGTTEDGVRVCAAHADSFEAEGFKVTRDR